MKFLIMLCVGLYAGSLMAGPEMSTQKKSRGTAGVDETYLEGLQTNNPAGQKEKTSAQSDYKNPGHVYSKEDDQERMEYLDEQKKKGR